MLFLISVAVVIAVLVLFCPRPITWGGLGIGALLVVVIWFLVIFKPFSNGFSFEVTNQRYLVSVSDPFYENDNYFLISESVNGKKCYDFFQESDNGYRLQRVEINDRLTILETKESPRLVIYEKLPVDALAKVLSWPFIFGRKHELYLPYGYKTLSF